VAFDMFRVDTLSAETQHLCNFCWLIDQSVVDRQHKIFIGVSNSFAHTVKDHEEYILILPDEAAVRKKSVARYPYHTKTSQDAKGTPIGLLTAMISFSSRFVLI
jgi:hypothetical protein